MTGSLLVQVDGVSKKFCRSLKRSLWYGMQDVGKEIIGRRGDVNVLRKNEFWAVDDVSFELSRGECLGLIGPNGAGKSTLLKMLNGLIKPDRGSITMRGRVGALIELGAGFNPILTARENIYVNGSVLGFSKKQIDRKFDEIVDFSELEEFIDTPVQNYSSGMVVRLGFSIAAQLSPDILIIDEVLAVGDLGFRIKCFESLREKKRQGSSIILVSHNLIDIMRLADTGLLMNSGHCEFLGNVSEACSAYSILLSRKNVESADQTEHHIQSLQLLKSGLPCNRFETGDDIEALITIQSKSGLADARMNFHLDSSNVRINSTSSLVNATHIDLKPGLNQIRLTLANVDLLQGGYMLSVDLYGREYGEFFDHADPAEFYITGPATDLNGFGVAHLIRVRHRWDIV